MSVPAPQNNKLPIVVVGMGPGGQTAAIEMAEKGNAVMILENRELFTRVQKVYLNASSYEYLLALQERVKAKGIKDDIGDKFLESVAEDNQRVQVSDLQEFLESKIKQLYPKLITIKKSDHIQITEIKSDKDKPKVTYTDKGVAHTVAFSHLIAADGARRNIARLVEKQNRLPVTFKKLDIQLRHEAHGTINLDLLNPDAVPGQNIRASLELSDLPALRKHGWNKPYLPKIYVWPNVEIDKFYIAGELPPSFLKFKGETQQKALEAWGRTILQQLFQFKPKDFGLNLYKGNDPKLLGMNKLKTTVFPVILEYVEKNAYDLSGKPGAHAFIQIGDAARNANFYLGHGTNDAIADGIEVAKSLKVDNSMDMKKLQEHHLGKKQDVVTAMENARFYLDRSEMSIIGEAEKHYLSELTKLNQEAKKIVAEVLKPGHPRYQEIMRNFEKIAALVQNKQDAKFEDMYKITMEIFDVVQAELRTRHHVLLMETLNKQNYTKLLQRESDLKQEMDVIKQYIEAESKKAGSGQKISASMLAANKVKTDSDKFLENVSKWHSHLIKPSERLARIGQLEKEMQEIANKKLQSQQGPLLDKASEILNRFSGAAKYLKESHQIKAKLTEEQAQREKEVEALSSQDQVSDKMPSALIQNQKKSVPDKPEVASPKESRVKQLVKGYEQLTMKNANHHQPKAKPPQSPKKPKL